jgi:hypothetical protein
MRYFAYFVKYGKKYQDKVVLFQKGLRMQKFYQIGEWYRKSKGELWLEVRKAAKERREALERRSVTVEKQGSPNDVSVHDTRHLVQFKASFRKAPDANVDALKPIPDWDVVSSKILKRNYLIFHSGMPP